MLFKFDKELIHLLIIATPGYDRVVVLVSERGLSMLNDCPTFLVMNLKAPMC